MPSTPAEELCAELTHASPDADRVAEILAMGTSLSVRVNLRGHVQTPLGHWVLNGKLSLWPTLKPYMMPGLNTVPHRNVCLLALAAQSNGRIPLIETLLECGAWVDGPVLNGNNPLMCAVKAGALDAGQVLLSHGARTDVRTSMGETLLHVACSFSKDMWYLPLLQAGVDPDAVDNRRKSFWDMMRDMVSTTSELEKRTKLENDLLTLTSMASMHGSSESSAIRPRVRL